MPDFSKHIMQNWEWCQAYRSQMGKEAYWEYVSRVYGLLMNMQPDTYFSIEKNVKLENIDLFVKICCMFIQEQYMSNRPRNFCHTFSPDYTEIRCVKLHNSQIYSNTSNTVTSWYRQKIYTQKRTTG